MFTTGGQWAKRWFAERQVVIRSRGRIRYLTLSRRWQVAGLGLLLVGASAVARMTASYIVADRKMAHKQAEVELAEFSASDLRDLVMHLQDRLATANRELEQTRGRLASAAFQNTTLRSELYAADARLHSLDETHAALLAQRVEAQGQLKGAEEALNAKSGQIAHINHSLDATKNDLKMTEEQRAVLTRRVRELEGEVQTAANRSTQFKANWDQAQQKLQQLEAEREKVIAERDSLLARVSMLQSRPRTETRLRADRSTDVAAPAPTVAADTPAAAGPAVAEDSVVVASAGVGAGAVGQSGGETRPGWGEIGRLLSSAGVDLDQLAARFGAIRPGQGGPFIAPKGLKTNKSGDSDAAVPDALRKALKALPLAAPLAHYQLESRFGVRHDPFNRRPAMHTGLDFSAPFKSPVYNTAPGTVIFAGSKGEFGRVVDIDHGSGIVTRYAHLHRITVALGQRLNGREQIGLLGSSGRSTGPHVHYEVQVNGVPQDPEKFLQAGTIVQISN
jgi:murein DD-endopeptidase MepM/ murein hydrolase activator NlpD